MKKDATCQLKDELHNTYRYCYCGETHKYSQNITNNKMDFDAGALTWMPLPSRT